MSKIRPDQEEEEEAAAKTINNRPSPHEYSRNYLVPMSNNYDRIKELTWENGQVSLSMLPKQIYGGDTLESIVRQGYNTTFKSFDGQNDNQESGKLLSSSAEKWIPNPSSSQQQVEVDEYSSMPTFSGGFDQKKRARISESEKLYREMKRYHHHKQLVDDQRAPEISACASASAAFCREKDSTMMTWPSFESPRSLKNSRKGEDLDSACNDFSENQDGERMTIEDDTAYRSQSSARRSRASAIHNQSERRRRDRINQKMKALQKLVPNASKTDKASMLDEVIQYLKQLQAQVQMMSNARMINQQQQQQMMMMMMPPSANNNGNTIQQQQFQMSLLSRMGMFDMARNMQNPFFTPSSFVMPPMINPNLSNIPLKINNGSNSAVPTFNSNAYNAFLTQQSMNADFFNKMATLYGETANQMSKNQVTLSQPSINGTHGQ